VIDECYYSFQLNPDIHVLLSADMTTVEDEGKMDYPGETFGTQFPLCWCHQFEGGRQWYTALGHDPEFYKDPLFVEHLRGGLLWVLDTR
jgi:type 1 glutamine amidotransferase